MFRIKTGAALSNRKRTEDIEQQQRPIKERPNANPRYFCAAPDFIFQRIGQLNHRYFIKTVTCKAGGNANSFSVLLDITDSKYIENADEGKIIYKIIYVDLSRFQD